MGLKGFSIFAAKEISCDRVANLWDYVPKMNKIGAFETEFVSL